MTDDDGFGELMARLQAGDQTAETLVFRRYVHRLIVLAGRQFDAPLRAKADVEGIVQSVCTSFFLRHRRGEFAFEDWDALWSILATITLRKCVNHRHFLRAARRDARRETSGRTEEIMGLPIPDRQPTPAEAAILAETVEQFFTAIDPEDRPIVQHILMGYTALEVAEQLECSERTVRRVRQRAKRRLERLLTTGNERDGSA